MDSDRSAHIVYGGVGLKPCTRYDVRLYISDDQGAKAEESTWFETGLLSWKNMKACWITHRQADEMEACAVFKRRFSCRGQIVRARLYASALGIYEARLNGMAVSDTLFAPGWTNYKVRLQYQTYDVTQLLDGENTLEITVGNGWYKGILGFEGRGDHYGSRTAVIARLALTYADGHTEDILTDESWTQTKFLRLEGIPERQPLGSC